MIARRLFLVATVIATLGAPASAQTTPQIPPPADTRAGVPADERPVGGLRAGDLLRVTVFREKELSGEFLIDARGDVQMPGIGVLNVAGLEPRQAQQRIVEALRARGFSAPEVALQARVQVSVLGEVRSPALYPTEPGTSLLQLITLAGGPTERANLRATRVMRDGTVVEVDLERALEGSAAGRIVLYSGDYVIVPRRGGLTRDAFMFGLSVATSVMTAIGLAITLRRS